PPVYYAQELQQWRPPSFAGSQSYLTRQISLPPSRQASLTRVDTSIHQQQRQLSQPSTMQSRPSPARSYVEQRPVAPPPPPPRAPLAAPTWSSRVVPGAQSVNASDVETQPPTATLVRQPPPPPAAVLNARPALYDNRFTAARSAN